DPKACRVDKVPKQPIQRESPGNAFDQIGKPISERGDDEGGIAEQENTDKDRKVFQRFKGLRARHQNNEGAQVASGQDKDKRQHDAAERFRIPSLPLSAQPPASRRPECEAAESAHHKNESDQVTESSPYLQER